MLTRTEIRRREDELIDQVWERLYLATPLAERGDVLRARDMFLNQLDKLREDPMTTSIPLMAPDMSAQVQQTINEHPEIDTMDEAERGAIIDITDWRVNGGIDRPWGRKARSNDPSNPNLNTDGMTYLRPDGLFEIYDCISGTNGQATWDGYGPFVQGENGWWWPPQPVEDQPAPAPPVQDQIDALSDRVETLETYVTTLEERLTVVEGVLAGGLHAHGPVNLPIVFQDITHLRAKGDIDVEVKVGMPASESAAANDPNQVEAAGLRRWLDE